MSSRPEIGAPTFAYMEYAMHLEREIERLKAARQQDRELADRLLKFANDDAERLRAALEKHHDLLSDEPGDNCDTCGTTWDGALERI